MDSAREEMDRTQMEVQRAYLESLRRDESTRVQRERNSEREFSLRVAHLEKWVEMYSADSRRETLRDQFASGAMNGLLIADSDVPASAIASRAFEIADAMLATRGK